MHFETFSSLKIAVTYGTMYPGVIALFVCLSTHFTRVVAFMLVFVVVSFLTFCAKITFVHKGCHTRDDIKMVIMIVHIYLLVLFGARIDNGIEMLF